MKIKLIPDARDEEKIAEIKKALETLEDYALEEDLDGKASDGEEWLDAMYYASEEQGDSILATWEEYFHDRLLDDEKHYFAAAVGDYDF